MKIDIDLTQIREYIMGVGLVNFMTFPVFHTTHQVKAMWFSLVSATNP